MSKKPRPTMAETMGSIAAMAARSSVRSEAPVPQIEPDSTLPREPADTLQRENVSTLAREPATTLAREHGTTRPKGFNVRKERVEKPHQSLYAHPDVFKAIRQIAAAEDCKPQDLYREALRLMLAKRGLDFDRLDGGR